MKAVLKNNLFSFKLTLTKSLPGVYAMWPKSKFTSLASFLVKLELLSAIASSNSYVSLVLQTSRVHPFNHYSAKTRVISPNS